LKKENNRNDKKNTLIVAEIKNVNKEPAIKFIDKRFANVRDWNKIENDSSNNRKYRKNSTLVKNKYNKYEIKDNPDPNKCNNNDIKITIKLKR